MRERLRTQGRFAEGGGPFFVTPRITVVCARCATAFETPAHHGGRPPRKYCSGACYRAMHAEARARPYCGKCDQRKDASEFYHRPNGEPVYPCIPCAKEANRGSFTQWKQKNPGRIRVVELARRVVACAMTRGLLVRADTCETCGQAGRIQAAHGDYSKPLEIRWLCKRCHNHWDQAEPKSLGEVNEEEIEAVLATLRSVQTDHVYQCLYCPREVRGNAIAVHQNACKRDNNGVPYRRLQ